MAVNDTLTRRQEILNQYRQQKSDERKNALEQYRASKQQREAKLQSYRTNKALELSGVMPSPQPDTSRQDAAVKALEASRTKGILPENYQQMVEEQTLKTPIYDPVDMLVDAATAGAYTPIKAGGKALGKAALREMIEGGLVGAGMVGADKLGGGTVAQLAAGLGSATAGKLAYTGIRQGVKELAEQLVKKGVPRKEAVNIAENTVRRTSPKGKLPDIQADYSLVVGDTIPAKAKGFVDPVTRKQIIDKVSKEFAPWRTGRIGVKNARGVYKTGSQVIRTRKYGNVNTAMHEVGHFLDQKLGLSQLDTGELSKLGQETSLATYTPDQVRAEGVAQFFRRYFLNPDLAKQDAPQYFKKVDVLIKSDPKLSKSVDEVREMSQAWYNQSALNRAVGTISFADDKKPLDIKKTVKDVSGELRRALFDRYQPLDRLGQDALSQLDELKKKGLISEADYSKYVYKGKLKDAADPLLNAQLSSGAPRASELEINRFSKIMGDIPEYEYKGFSAFTKAKRSINQAANGIEPDIPIDEANVIINTAPERWKKAQKELVKQNKRTLAVLMDKGNPNGGIITREHYDQLVKKWPDYVPFFRDMSDDDVINALNPGRTGRNLANIGQPLKKMKGSTRNTLDPVESSLANIQRFHSLVARNRVGQAIYDIGQIPGMGEMAEIVDGPARAADNVISVWINGQRKSVKVDPMVYNAMLGMGEKGRSAIRKIFRASTQVLRKGAVDWNPYFAYRNMFRDTMQGAIASEANVKPFLGFMQGFMHYLGKDNAYRRAVKAGIGSSTFIGNNRFKTSRELREFMQTPEYKKVLDKFKIWRGMEYLGQGSEMATRISEHEAGLRKIYRNALLEAKRKGMGNPQQYARQILKENRGRAAQAAQDVTLAFSQGGTVSKEANDFVAFFNASMLGMDKVYRMFRDNPVRTSARTFMYITLPSMALWAMNHDNPQYQELPRWKKSLFWYVPVKDKLIPIPKPFELGVVFGSGPEIMLDKMFGGNKDAAKEFGKSVFDILSPGFMPNAMGPIIENATNHSMFFDTDIVPEYQKGLPSEMQYGPNTSEVSKWVGRKLKISPRKIDNLIYGYTSTGGRNLMKAVDYLASKAGKRVESPDKPFGLGTFYETGFRNAQSISDLYDKSEEIEKKINATKQMGKIYGDLNVEEVKQYKKIQQAKRALSVLWKARRQIMESSELDGAEKKEMLDKISMGAMNISRVTLGKQPITIDNKE